MCVELWGLQHTAWQGQPLLGASCRHVAKEVQREHIYFFSQEKSAIHFFKCKIS